MSDHQKPSVYHGNQTVKGSLLPDACPFGNITVPNGPPSGFDLVDLFGVDCVAGGREIVDGILWVKKQQKTL